MSLHNPRESVVVRIGMGCRRLFAANSRTIGKKTTRTGLPKPYHWVPGYIWDILKTSPGAGIGSGVYIDTVNAAIWKRHGLWCRGTGAGCSALLVVGT